MKRVFIDTLGMFLVLFTLALLLTGCAGWGGVKAGVAGYGAQVADEARISAEWTLCNAISVGAWSRAYGSDYNKAEAWKILCSKTAVTTP